MSDRTLLLDLLEAYTPHDEYQHVTKLRFLDFVKTSFDCFLRSNLSGHVTGSCWLLDPSKKDILLTHHKKIGEWLQLGGHADGDPDILRVALREAEEESGIIGCTAVDKAIFDLDIHTIPEHKGVAAHLHYDVRFVILAPHKNFDVSEESHDLLWVPISTLASAPSTNDSLRRMAKLWMARLTS